jgi:hypothetical protein
VNLIDGGIVHQNIQAAEIFYRVFYKSHRILFDADVGRKTVGFSSGSFYFPAHLLQFIRRTGGQRHPNAMLRQGQSNTAPDSTPCACDNGDFSL